MAGDLATPGGLVLRLGLPHNHKCPQRARARREPHPPCSLASLGDSSVPLGGIRAGAAEQKGDMARVALGNKGLRLVGILPVALCVPFRMMSSPRY